MEEENAQKKKRRVTILAIITVILYVIIFFMVDSMDKEEARRQANIVTNYSEFYTVSSCADKYTNFLAAKDTEALLNVLSEGYKKKNFITAANILDALPIISGGSTFAANRIYYEEQKDGIFKYYVSGYLETGGLEMNERSRVPSYLIIYLDKKNTIFAVEPYDGAEYKEGVFE